MIVQLDQEFNKKFTRDGSHLKFCRSNGGIGAGLTGVGIMTVLAALFLGFFGSWILFMVCGAGIGAFLTVLGIMMRRKRRDGYLSYYCRKNDYSSQEIEQLDREICSPNAQIHIYKKKLDKAGLRNGIILTDHWLKMPLTSSAAIRMIDIAAVWFDRMPYYQNTMLEPHLFILDSKGKINLLPMVEKNAEEFIAEACKRNSRLITVKEFEYQDNFYNCLAQSKAVAELYRNQEL